MSQDAGSKVIKAPYYPIVYVRGYAMRRDEREDVFHDTYYGFSATSVERREVPPEKGYFEADMFEGQLIRLMKLGEYSYADAVNRGLDVFPSNPARSVWVCRFYDADYFRDSIRKIEEHGEDLRVLVCEKIPARLKEAGVDLGSNDEDYRVILVAHSMGGLVCRNLIQNLLPGRNQDPKRWIHRLVTMGTPHRGIDLGAIPNFLENFMVESLNPFDANIFQHDRMRQYLKLTALRPGVRRTKQPKEEDYLYDVHSLGPQDTEFSFPVSRCLCLIGSDYRSYGAVKHATGNFSDGLVKQDRAYLVGGDRPPENAEYLELQRAFWANVHRAHSGFRGIVNSYESFENIHRFLFGNTMARLSLEGLKILTPPQPKSVYFYDVEVLVAIRGTAAYLHRREQDLCENALRYERSRIPDSIHLHTGFMNSSLRPTDSEFSHFAITLRLVERRVKDGLLWDTDYPAKAIFTETFEVRVGDFDGDQKASVQARRLSSSDGWSELVRTGGFMDLELVSTVVSGTLRITPMPWGP